MVFHVIDHQRRALVIKNLDGWMAVTCCALKQRISNLSVSECLPLFRAPEILDARSSSGLLLTGNAKRISELGICRAKTGKV